MSRIKELANTLEQLANQAAALDRQRGEHHLPLLMSVCSDAKQSCLFLV